jgi:hypothetical protein
VVVVVAVVACLVQEGWLDVKQGDTWTKHWCLVTEMRQIKEKLESHAGQTAAGSYDPLPPIIPSHILFRPRDAQLTLNAFAASHTHAHSDDEVDEKWAGWGLAIFEELVDKSLLDFVEELTAAGTGVKVTTHPRLPFR